MTREKTDELSEKSKKLAGKGATLTDSEVVDLADEISDPFSTIAQAAETVGLTRDQTRRLMDRMKAQYQPLISEMQTVKTSQLTKMLDDRAMRALEWLDDFALAKASAKDLAIVAGIMLEKRAMLRGEPTHIVSTQERASLQELAPLMMDELQRRGLAVLDTSEMVEVQSPGPERAARPRAPKKIGKDIYLSKKAEIKAEIGEE